MEIGNTMYPLEYFFTTHNLTTVMLAHLPQVSYVYYDPYTPHGLLQIILCLQVVWISMLKQ